MIVLNGSCPSNRRLFSTCRMSCEWRNTRPGHRRSILRMDVPLLLASAVSSFVATCVFLPWLIRSLKGTTAVGRDLNKQARPLVPEMGGLGVIIGFYVGVAVILVFGSTQVPGSLINASLSAALGAGVVGLIDDMFRLRKRTKAVLPFLLALPLGAAAYASGDRTILTINVGILIVVAIALGVTAAGNAANMLEGLNGLGAGLGVIVTFTLIVLSLEKGAEEGLFLLFPLFGALVAFLLFNIYPARVFPGDSMTLFTGAAIASAAIISSPPLKTYAVVLLAPMIVEFLLKARGRFRAENYGSPAIDGRLQWQGRVESLVHLVMRWKSFKEWQIVIVLWGVEGAVCLAVIAMVGLGH